MKVLYVGEEPTKEDLGKDSIFLAGPSPRGNEGVNWRPEALELLRQLGFTGVAYVPLLEDGGWLDNFNMQMDWELKYLDYADVIAFWVPRDMETLPGLTTNIEFGMYVKSGKIVLGYPLFAARMRYMGRLARLHDVRVAATLHDTLMLAMNHLKSDD